MSQSEEPVVPGQVDPNHNPTPREGKLETILSRIDLAAVLVSLLGLCLLAVTVAVMAIADLAKVISGLCANDYDRWLVALAGLAAIWVAARWKKLCVF